MPKPRIACAFAALAGEARLAGPGADGRREPKDRYVEIGVVRASVAARSGSRAGCNG